MIGLYNHLGNSDGCDVKTAERLFLHWFLVTLSLRKRN